MEIFRLPIFFFFGNYFVPYLKSVSQFPYSDLTKKTRGEALRNEANKGKNLFLNHFDDRQRPVLTNYPNVIREPFLEICKFFLSTPNV